MNIWSRKWIKLNNKIKKKLVWNECWWNHSIYETFTCAIMIMYEQLHNIHAFILKHVFKVELNLYKYFCINHHLVSWIFYLFMIFHVFQGYLYQSFPHSCWFRWYICEHWSGFTTKGEFKVFPKVLQVLDKKKFQFKLSFHSSKEVCLQVCHVYVSSLFVCRFFLYDSYI